MSKTRYKEPVASLAVRIDAHKKYSKHEINDWILEQIGIKDGEKVFDVGCGMGKQTIAFAKKAGPHGLVIGCDISQEMIEEAKRVAERAGVNATFINHDATRSFKFESDFFDVISCCFTIYYIANVESTILEFKRILRRGGRVFLAGPTPNNASSLRKLHGKVTNKPLPYTPGIARFRSEVLPIVKKHFRSVRTDIFRNALTFCTIDSFVKYYTSTLLFQKSSEKQEKQSEHLRSMKKEIGDIILRERKFEVLKEVLGILGIK